MPSADLPLDPALLGGATPGAPPAEVAPFDCASSQDPAPSLPPRRHWWLREPLLHFVMVGGLLFALDFALTNDDDDPNVIVVTAEADRDAIETFEASRGREPNAEELTALRQIWLDNEVLYREGLALQVDRGDTAIRERVIFKALSMIDSTVTLPVIDEQALQQWFEQRRHKYDEPARYDFEEAVLSGAVTEERVRAFVERLNGSAGGDAEAGLRVFKARPESNIVQGYGEAVADGLAKLAPERWEAFETREGWRAMRLRSFTAAKRANFMALRGIIYRDWVDATSAEQRTQAVRELTKKYDVRYETQN